MLAKIPSKREDGKSKFADLIEYITNRDNDEEGPGDELDPSNRRGHHEILERARGHLLGAEEHLHASGRINFVDADAFRVRLEGVRRPTNPDEPAPRGIHRRIEGRANRSEDINDHSHQGSLARSGDNLRAAARYLRQAPQAGTDFQERARARRANIAFNAQAVDRNDERDGRSIIADLESGRLLGEPERVVTVTGVSCEHNCLSLATASSEMKAVAAQNVRVKDPVYHAVLSWPAVDSPSDAEAFECGKYAIAAVGMADHQYVFAVHRDTDNVHLHIAVNRVNPDSFVAVYPDRDYFKLDRAMRELELKYGWSHDNGPYAIFERNGSKVIDWSSSDPSTKEKRPTAAADMEAHADQESLFAYCRGDPRKALVKALKSEDFTWLELHTLLAKYGLELREKGQGFAIYDLASPATTPIKASDMHESLSKGRLTKRLGSFEPAGLKDEPVLKYDKHRPPKRDPEQREQRRQERADARRALRDRYDQYKNGFVFRRLNPIAVKQRFLIIRDDARRQRLEVRTTVADPLARKALYSVIAFETLRARDRLQRGVRDERATLRGDPSNRRIPYREWVEDLAASGDAAAISQLRGFLHNENRQVKKGISAGNNGIANGILFRGDVDPKATDLTGLEYRVRRDGSVLYRSGQGADEFIDRGSLIEMSKDRFIQDEVLHAALRLALEKNGGVVDLVGSEGFKQRAIEVMVRHGIQVPLNNASLEALHQRVASGHVYTGREPDIEAEATKNRKRKPRT